MGPRQSSQSLSRQKQFFQSYEMIQQLPNDNIRFLQHKQSKKEYLLRELSYTSKQQYLKAIQTIKNKRQQLKSSDHVIPLTEYFQKQEDQYCSTFYKLYVLYEYPQRTLDDEINERNLRKNNFTETQLWSILASCILGLSHLQKKGIRHGSLRSSMIFLSQQGLIKISDPFTTGCQTNYQTLLNKRTTRHIYLSPEQSEAIQAELISPTNINLYKSDIFTLGMIMLECGLLQYQDQCYRDEYSRIHIQTLQYNKNRFRKVYSQQLGNMLNYMLGEQAGTRPEWIQLQNYVITDNTSKSFISQGRKSNIMPHSKPVSVNVTHKNPGGYDQTTRQSAINNNNNTTNGVIFPTRTTISQRNTISQGNTIAQKPMPEQTPIYNAASVINKGIGLSSSKPISVQNVQPLPTQSNNAYRTSIQNFSTSVQNFIPSVQTINYPSRYPQHNVIVGEHTTINKPFNVQTMVQSIKKPGTPLVAYQNLHSLPKFPTSITTLPNFSKPYISESPLKSQTMSKNFDIPPVNISNISTTRPFRSVFPNPIYITKTKVDENLVQMDEDEPTSRSVSDISSYNNYQNQGQRNEEVGFNGVNGHYNNYNSIGNRHDESGYNQAHVSHQQSVRNFTPQSNTFAGSSNLSYQNSPPGDPTSHSKLHAGQFVVQTFKLGSRYQGYKLNGLRHGQGKFFYQDGGMYEGSWVQNKMEGYGKLYYQSAKIAYDGQWVQDQFTGHGVLYNENPDTLTQPFNYSNFDDVQQFWTKYEGQFLEDSKNGKGVLFLSNGEFFQGNFLNDNVEGEGIYTTMIGKQLRGIWENNVLVRQF